MAQHDWTPSSDAYTAADLWGIRDLILVGYAAPFVPDKFDARQSAVSLVYLLPTLHPYAPCRTSFGDLLKHSSCSCAPGSCDCFSFIALAAETALHCVGVAEEDFLQGSYVSTANLPSAKQLLADADSASPKNHEGAALRNPLPTGSCVGNARNFAIHPVEMCATVGPSELFPKSAYRCEDPAKRKAAQRTPLNDRLGACKLSSYPIGMMERQQPWWPRPCSYWLS